MFKKAELSLIQWTKSDSGNTRVCLLHAHTHMCVCVCHKYR